MGYLNETLQEIDTYIAAQGAGEEQRETVRLAFFMGAKAVFNATRETQRMEDREGIAFLTECRDECTRFFGEQLCSIVFAAFEVPQSD